MKIPEITFAETAAQTHKGGLFGVVSELIHDAAGNSGDQADDLILFVSPLYHALQECRKALENPDLEAYYTKQVEWSKNTFGPALRTKGIIDHITKELREIAADPTDLSEWVDVMILAMDGFWRHGGKPEELMARLQAKQDKNFARTWPDWRTMSEDHAIEHDRSGEVATPPTPVLVGAAQDGFTYVQCPDCDFDAVVTTAECNKPRCPICAGDKGEDVYMSKRPATANDKPEGIDERPAPPTAGIPTA